MPADAREQAAVKRARAERVRRQADMLSPPDRVRLRQYAEELEAEAIELERKAPKNRD